jgi:acetoin utilization protein AcuB
MLLRSGRFRHLPVVDGNGALVGMVDRDGLELFLSKAESPGVVKRQYRIDQVMVCDVVTVTPECPLEEAAALMVRHKIRCLPVVETGKVVGIVTETDIFEQFAAVLGGGSSALRLTVQVDDTPGQLAHLAGQIAEVQGNICSVVAHGASQPGRINITLRVEGAGREAVLAAVRGLPGVEVLHAWGCEAA